MKGYVRGNYNSREGNCIYLSIYLSNNDKIGELKASGYIARPGREENTTDVVYIGTMHLTIGVSVCFPTNKTNTIRPPISGNQPKGLYPIMGR